MTKQGMAASAAVAMVSLLTACGGGGGGGSASASTSTSSPAPTSNVSTATFQIAVAKSNEPQSLSLIGTAPDNSQVTVTVASSYGGQTTFEGVLVDYDVRTSIVKQGATLLASQTGYSFYTKSPSRWRGSVDSDGSAYMVATSTWSRPSTAKVGELGPAYSATIYGSSSKTSVTGYETATWSLEADTPLTAWLCTNIVRFDKFNVQTGTVAGCMKISPDGSILAHRGTVLTSVGIITFQ